MPSDDTSNAVPDLPVPPPRFARVPGRDPSVAEFVQHWWPVSAPSDTTTPTPSAEGK